MGALCRPSTCVCIFVPAADAANVTRPAWDAQHELCTNISFTSTLTLIRNWLEAPGNEREFLSLFLVRSHMHCRKKRLAGWSRWGLEAVGHLSIAAALQDDRVPRLRCNRTLEDVMSVLGPLLFTPAQLNASYGGVWPSRNVLLAAGKRVFVESDGDGVY